MKYKNNIAEYIYSFSRKCTKNNII